VEEKKKILFIINPISGVGKKNIIPQKIKENLNIKQFDYEITYTAYKKHSFEIAFENKNKFDVIVAIGGDGTVNEVGSALIHSNCKLAILPTGSGNGIARHLKIPLKISKAIQKINQFQFKSIDTGLIGDKVFIASCGFGFDAHIAHQFDKVKKRGFFTYIKLVWKEFRKYQEKEILVLMNNEEKVYKKFLFSVANCSEFGNGFTISPQSDETDGVFEIIGLEKFKFYQIPRIIRLFFRKKIHQSPLYFVEKFNDSILISVKNQEEFIFHVDGEVFKTKNQLNIDIKEKSLCVLV